MRALTLNRFCEGIIIALHQRGVSHFHVGDPAGEAAFYNALMHCLSLAVLDQTPAAADFETLPQDQATRRILSYLEICRVAHRRGEWLAATFSSWWGNCLLDLSPLPAQEWRRLADEFLKHYAPSLLFKTDDDWLAIPDYSLPDR